MTLTQVLVCSALTLLGFVSSFFNSREFALWGPNRHPVRAVALTGALAFLLWFTLYKSEYPEAFLTLFVGSTTGTVFDMVRALRVRAAARVKTNQPQPHANT
jgi:predicted neutral ceramidase superfamily lipid hydrolase